MSRPDVLVVWPIRPEQMSELDRTYTLHRYDEAADKDAFLNGRAAAIRAVVTTGGKGFTADLLEKLPNLEIVASSGVGTDTLDVAACKAPRRAGDEHARRAQRRRRRPRLRPRHRLPAPDAAGLRLREVRRLGPRRA